MRSIQLNEKDCAFVIRENGVGELFICNADEKGGFMPSHSLAMTELAMILKDAGVKVLEEQFKRRARGLPEVLQ